MFNHKLAPRWKLPVLNHVSRAPGFRCAQFVLQCWCGRVVVDDYRTHGHNRQRILDRNCHYAGTEFRATVGLQAFHLDCTYNQLYSSKN